MGKAIYLPKGKAAEYSKYAVNFYNGCSSDCSYCYCKTGSMGILWSKNPTIKKTLIDEETALEIFKKEAHKNLEELQQHGLFFNFNSDPFLKETAKLNLEAMNICDSLEIPIIALTKQTWWSQNGSSDLEFNMCRTLKHMNIGFTFTGHDELEPGAATNKSRIEAIEYFFIKGCKVWASIEPIIDFKSSTKMISKTLKSVNHYKIGLLSGCIYNHTHLMEFIDYVNMIVRTYYDNWGKKITIYWKDGLLRQAGIERKDLPEFCVDRDYRWWL